MGGLCLGRFDHQTDLRNIYFNYHQGLLALELQVLPAQVLRPDPVHPNRRGLFRPLLPDQLQLHLLPQERQVPLVSGERTLPWRGDTW